MITVYLITSDGSTLIAEQGCNWYDISSAVVKQTLNEVSSATLKFPSSNQRVQNLLSMNRPVIEIMDDGARVFYGAVVNIKVDIWDNVEFDCDGALSFLSEIVKAPFARSGITVAAYFKELIDQYNGVMTTNGTTERAVWHGGALGFDSDGNVSIDHSDEYMDYLSLIKELVELYGGYIYETFGSDTAHPYAGWSKDPAVDSGKIIEFGVNEIGLSNLLDFSNYASRVYATGNGVSLATDYVIDSAAEAAYGRRDMAYKSSTSNGVVLAAEALVVLFKHSNPVKSVEMTVADFKQLGLDYSGFALGTTAKLIERKTGIEQTMMVNTVERDFMSPQNSKIVLGRAPITLTSSI